MIELQASSHRPPMTIAISDQLAKSTINVHANRVFKPA